MAASVLRLAFGPVPSRRLGWSLGINNIPPKACSYSCRYCQVGPTAHTEIEPRAFYAPEALLRAVESKLDEAIRAGARIDYLTFVPDGEPTLDVHLEEAIAQLRRLGHRIAVISNGSLVARPEARAALMAADWVSLKVDAAEETCWRRINRPHPSLALASIHEGMLALRQVFGGELVTETMLVAGVNDDARSVDAVATLLARLRPSRAYLGVPIRPVTDPNARRPEKSVVERARRRIEKTGVPVALLVEDERDAFTSTGDPSEDLLAITAVHPMREEAVLAMMRQVRGGLEALSGLLAEGRLAVVEHEGRRFYVRRLRGET